MTAIQQLQAKDPKKSITAEELEKLLKQFRADIILEIVNANYAAVRKGGKL